ncbi:hypothetical protein quinque_005342 [Culex quinquefasciatus]
MRFRRKTRGQGSGEEVRFSPSGGRGRGREGGGGLVEEFVGSGRFEATGEEENLQPEEEEAVPVPEAEEVAATCSDEAKLGRTRKREAKEEERKL